MRLLRTQVKNKLWIKTMALTDVREGGDGKPCLLRGPAPHHDLVRCTGVTAYGDPCKRYAHGRLDGSPVCKSHFTPVKPRNRPTPEQVEAQKRRAIVKARAQLRLMRLVTMLNNVVKLEESETAECPVCMDEFVATEKARCGHTVCSTCCSHMKESGRTLKCPMCRDTRFASFVEYKCV